MIKGHVVTKVAVLILVLVLFAVFIREWHATTYLKGRFDSNIRALEVLVPASRSLGGQNDKLSTAIDMLAVETSLLIDDSNLGERESTTLRSYLLLRKEFPSTFTGAAAQSVTKSINNIDLFLTK